MKLLWLTVLIGIWCFLFGEACQYGGGVSSAPSGGLTEVKRAIDKRNAQLGNAWKTGDPALISDLFTEDAVLLVPNGNLIKGRAAILERHKAAMTSIGKSLEITVTTTDIWLDGDTAYETGKYSHKSQEKAQSINEEGRYVTIWKRQTDNSWKLVMDMGLSQN